MTDTIERLYPRPGLTTATEVAARAQNAAHGSIHSFDTDVIAFLDQLSKELFGLSRAEPALAPLAFFMRKSATTRLTREALEQLPIGSVAVPQGVILHIPPTNVDTLFLYTLAIALLSGNSNIVRISEHAGPATHDILQVLFRILDRYPAIAKLVTVVRFSRNDVVLQNLTSVADVRMIWGGDASINAIRRAPLQPHAKDLSFPDRLSVAAIKVVAWAAANDEEKASLAGALYNDTYWFDQMACSSPQQIILVGPIGESKVVFSEILRELSGIAKKRYKLPDGQAINKMVAVVEGIARGSKMVEWASNSSVSVGSLLLEDAVDIRPGGGFFSSQRFDHLIEFAPQITRRIQTLTTFGFTPDELRDFVTELNGRGIDRIVPIGKALDFSQIWDGKNLVLEMIRLVTIGST